MIQTEPDTTITRIITVNAKATTFQRLLGRAVHVQEVDDVHEDLHDGQREGSRRARCRP